ncbi:MAG: precorrin-2 C(20)-methyltransferase, partial [Desulfuromonadales bacterium]|nr:precorrin-2 C(20)-methyltransferase [Desulfuromonadales bacterium]
CEVRTVEFSLGKDARQRQSHWGETACEIAELLRSGQDVAFVTLGDSLLYSTYIYLIRALRSEFAAARIETVPGISAFSSAAAITSTPLGEGNSSLQVIPSSNDLTQIEKAVASGDAVVLMKIGKRLNVIIDLLEKAGALQRSVFVARAGLPEQRVETNLESLRGAEPSTGNLAVIIVPAVLIE